MLCSEHPDPLPHISPVPLVHHPTFAVGIFDALRGARETDCALNQGSYFHASDRVSKWSFIMNALIFQIFLLLPKILSLYSNCQQIQSGKTCNQFCLCSLLSCTIRKSLREGGMVYQLPTLLFLYPASYFLYSYPMFS